MEKKEIKEEMKTETNTQNTGKGTGKKGNNKSTGQGTKGGNPRGKFTGKRNDPSWYSPGDAIVKAGCSIPYNRFPGAREDLGFEKYNEQTATSVPGVMTIEYQHAPGLSKDATSPVNVAARALYTWVRHQNSGHTNYEASDLMIYILAMQSVYSQYLEACRVYKTCMTYNLTNRYIPDLLVKAMGVDPEDVRSNLANFRSELNIIAAKLSSMAVPAKFTSVQRAAYLAGEIFTDSDSLKGQFYLPIRSRYLIYDPTQSYGGALVATEWTNTGASVPTIGAFGLHKFRTSADIIKDLNAALDPILRDEDMNIMSGDILKAYGRENCFLVAGVDENATQGFTFDINFLEQVHNGFTFYGHADYEDASITQLNNSVICTPSARQSASGTNVDIRFEILKEFGNVSRYFNSHADAAKPEDFLDWSRLANSIDTFDSDEGVLYLNVGSELVTGFRMWLYYYEADSSSYSLLSDEIRSIMSVPELADGTLVLLSKFDWHPMIYIFDYDSRTYLGVVADLKNYTLVHNAIYSRTNDIAVLGEYGKQLELFMK